MITQAGTCIQRIAKPNCSGVSARINANSSTAKAAAAIAITEKTRFARAVRSFHQTRVTQLIGTGLESKRCEDRAETTRSGSIRKTISRGESQRVKNLAHILL